MNSYEILRVLKELRFKYSKNNPPEWYKGATEEAKMAYDKTRDERYASLDFAIKLVKSYRSLETAKEQISETLNTLKGDEPKNE